MSAHERKVMMMVINNLDAQVRWFIDEHKRLSDRFVEARRAAMTLVERLSP